MVKFRKEVTRAVEGPLINSKSIFRPFDKSKIKYTTDFKNVDSEINYNTFAEKIEVLTKLFG